jgi:hypothetical protein
MAFISVISAVSATSDDAAKMSNPRLNHQNNLIVMSTGLM